MARLRFGPRLMAVCAHLRISPQLLEHTQIPELRAIVQIRLPLAGAPEGIALPSQHPSSGWLASRPRAPNAPGAGSTCAGGTPGLPATAAGYPTPRAASSTTFLRSSLLQASRISGTWSGQGPAIRSCKLASAALLLLILLLSLSPNLALGLQARPPPLSPMRKTRAMVARALPPLVRLPAGGRALVGGSALPGPACAFAECLPRLGCRLPAGNRGPGWVMCCTCAAPSPRLVRFLRRAVVASSDCSRLPCCLSFCWLLDCAQTDREGTPEPLRY